ncbi:MAG TPA: HlyD family efflux transporter periplasmic adaptor subunit [Chthoniobacteraceae bacterium]|nr:HlyD family efflux transporter periplasmic adaptor subunit [Chthoniobacteraceae bacterium]
MKNSPPTSTLRNAKGAADRNRQRPGAWKKLIPYAIGAALIGGIIIGLMPKPIEVELATVTTGPLTVSVLEEGKTRIRHRYTVSPPVSGYLNRVELRAGDRIEAGKTVLATIQPQPASFLDPRTRAEAEARVRTSEAAKLQRGAQVDRARASLQLAEKELARAKELKRSGAIAARDWDTAESQVNVLQRELHAAEFGLQVAEFERAQAEAALLQAENPNAAKTEPLPILAPVSGFILNVHEESARIVAAGAPIMEVGDPTDLEAEIELLSTDAVGVQPGAPVTIEQWGGDAPLHGKVIVVEPGGFTKISALGVEEQRVRVRVNFTEALPPGRTLGDRFRVEARIVTWTSPGVLQVPMGALFRRGGDWMTFRFAGGKAWLTKVEIAHNNGVVAEVRSGLEKDARVILHPPDAVADGASVKARRTH